jgi:hypothetical protein
MPKVFVLTAQNTTTSVDLMKKRGGKVPQVDFVEFLEQGFILEFPHRSCAVGHSLELKLKLMPGNEPTKVRVPETFFECSAKVESIEHFEGERDAVSVTLIQFEAVEWEKFLTVFDKTNEHFDHLFKAVKG